MCHEGVLSKPYEGCYGERRNRGIDDCDVKGFDFTSAPRRKKPITCARGLFTTDLLQIERVDCITDFGQFEASLNEPGPRIAGFDFPFSLPRVFVEQTGWPLQSLACLCWDRRRLNRPFGATALGNRRAASTRAGQLTSLQTHEVHLCWITRQWRLANAGLCIAPCRLCEDNR